MIERRKKERRKKGRQEISSKGFVLPIFLSGQHSRQKGGKEERS